VGALSYRDSTSARRDVDIKDDIAKYTNRATCEIFNCWCPEADVKDLS
jgi:hypothetical protein